MRGFGYTMVVLGAIGLLLGFAMDTSVGNGIASRVENIGALSRQSNSIITSVVLFATGCILVGLAAVRDAVDRLGPVIVANAPRALPPDPQRSATVATTPSPSAGQPDAPAPPAADPAFSKTCPDCGSISVGVAKTCRRCGHQYSASGVAGPRVRHPSYGEGVLESTSGHQAVVRFDMLAEPETVRKADLTLIEEKAT